MDSAGKRPSDLVRIIENDWFCRWPRKSTFRSTLARGIKNLSKRLSVLSAGAEGGRSDRAKTLYKSC